MSLKKKKDFFLLLEQNSNHYLNNPLINILQLLNEAPLIGKMQKATKDD